MKLLTAFCIAVLAIAIATPAFAAVQNIKVSGSIDTRAIVNRDRDLKNESLESTAAVNPSQRQPMLAVPIFGSGSSRNADDDEFILSTVKVGIDADLTDNVSTTLTLANQSRWGSTPNWQGLVSQYKTTAATTLTGVEEADGNNNIGNIDLNAAYVTLKEFFYSPLTLRIGRQPLTYGQGFIVGAGLLRDPNGAFPQPTQLQYDPITSTQANLANPIAVPFSGPQGREYSISNSYDALRTTLDFDPWTVDGVFALIDETNTLKDDEFLTGVNVGYKFDVYNAGLEGYYFYNKDENFNSTLGYVRQSTISTQATIMAGVVPSLVANITNSVNNAAALDNTVPGVGSRAYEENIVHVVGLRGDIEPVENLSLSGEGAFQFGELIDDTGPWGVRAAGPLERDRRAWAVDVEGDYTWTEVSYRPSLGAGYTFLSGEENQNNGDFEAWDPMFKGKFSSKIRAFQAGDQTDWSGIGGSLYEAIDENDTAGNTNSHTVFVDGGLRPLEDLTLQARYLHFWFHETPLDGRSRTIGDEVDASLVYDYTEDVQFDLTGAWFLPGKYYDGATELSAARQTLNDMRSNDIATSVTGSVRVAF